MLEKTRLEMFQFLSDIFAFFSLYNPYFLSRRSCVQSYFHPTQVLVQLDDTDHGERGLRIRVPLHAAPAVPKLQAQVGRASALVNIYSTRIYVSLFVYMFETYLLRN